VHVGHRLECVTTAEFDWSAEGIPYRQPNECAQGPICYSSVIAVIHQ
jgi:hypothetical protein